MRSREIVSGVRDGVVMNYGGAATSRPAYLAPHHPTMSIAPLHLGDGPVSSLSHPSLKTMQQATHALLS